MGRSVALVVAITLFGLDAGPAFAANIKLTATRQQVKAACAKLGDNGSCGGCGATSGRYSCDNLANGCYVDCNANGSCTGGCPDKVVAVPRSRLQDLLAGVGQAAAQPGAPSPRPRRIPGGGLLEGTPGFSNQGPAATGSPIGGGAPAPAAGPVLR